MDVQKIQLSGGGGVVQLQRRLNVEKGHHARKELAIVGQSLAVIKGEDCITY